MVGWKGGGTEIAKVPEVNAMFEQQYPGTKIRYKYVRYADYDTYNNPRLVAGTAADVLMVDKAHMVTWAPQGYLADLTDQPWTARMLPALAPFNSIQGKTYVFNQENIPIGMYTNLALLEKVGVTAVPQSWPEFIAVLNALKAEGLGGLLLSSKDGWSPRNLAMALATNTVLPAAPTWASDYNAGKAHFDPTWTPVIDQLKQLFNQGLVDGKLMMGIDTWGQALDEFKAGKWAFTIQGAWELTDFTANARFPVSFDPVPGGPAGSQPRTFTFVGTGWSVNEHASNAEAARNYVNLWAQTATAEAYLQAENGFSTLRDVRSAIAAQGQPALDAYNTGRTSPSPMQALTYNDAETQLMNELEKLMLKPGTPTVDVLRALDRAVPHTA